MYRKSVEELIDSFRPWYTKEVRNSKRLVDHLNDNGWSCEYRAQGVDIWGSGFAIECKRELKNRNHDLTRSTQLCRDFSSLPFGTRTFVVVFGDAKQTLVRELKQCYAAFGFSPKIIVKGEIIGNVGTVNRNSCSMPDIISMLWSY